MSGVVEKIKEKLHMGGHHDHTSTEGRVIGRDEPTGVTETRTERCTHEPKTQGENCQQCHDKYHQEGKHVIWGNAQNKTGDAAEAARLAEVNACRAEKQLHSVAERQAEADRARTRLSELENELASLRSQGVDLTKKNREIEVARQRAQETATRAKEAAREAQEAERNAALREREAAELSRKHQHAQGAIGPIEEELARLSRAKQEAQAKHERHLAAMREWENGSQARKAEIERLHKERDGHANAVREAEAALAAARDRHHHTHTRLSALTKEHESGLKDADTMKGHGNSALQELERIKAREAELMRELESRRPAVDEHSAAARRAAELAEAERARAAEARRGVEPISREAQQHRAAVGEVQREATEMQEAERARRQEEQALAGQLHQHQRRTAEMVSEKEALADKYTHYKEQAVDANQRKEQLWDEAMHLGGVGDRNADSKLRNLEKKLEGVDISGTKGKDGSHTVTRTQHTVTEE